VPEFSLATAQARSITANYFAGERVSLSAPSEPQGEIIMHGNHFWLRVHQLADAFERHGSSDDQRAWQIINELMEMPPEMQGQSLAHVAKLSRVLATVAAASNVSTC